jgi:hypothetical protein
MLPVFTAGINVRLRLDVPTVDGVALTNPVTVEYAVFDEAGDEVVARTTLNGTFTSGESTFVVQVNAANNTLSGDATRAYRRVEVYFDKTGGNVYTVSNAYVIAPRATDQLVRMKNSFLLFGEAAVLRTEMERLDGWDTAAEIDAILRPLRSRLLRSSLQVHP